MEISNADLVNAEGIVRAAKAARAESFHVDIDFLLALVAECRKHRGIERKPKT